MPGISDVIEFAKANGGIVTRAEAIACGLSSSSLSRRIGEGVLVRVKAGVYTLPGATDHHRSLLAGACRKLGAVVSHESAAFLQGLYRARFIKPSVSVPVRRTKEFDGVTVHQLTDLDDVYIRPVMGLPTTTPERTVIDLASVMTERMLESIVDQGLAAGLLDLQQMSDVFEELGRRGKPGTAALRRVLGRRTGDYVPPNSVLEQRVLTLLRDSEVPEPMAQWTPEWLAPSNGRVDFSYPDRRLVIECDGRRWHTLYHSFEIDRLRDNAAQLAGWRILRFTWREVVDNPERVVRTVRKVLED